MRKLRISLFSSLFISLLFFSSLSIASDEPDLGEGRISLLQGQVLLQTREEKDWTEASVNFPVMGGDRILTERDGRAEIQFMNETYVRMGEASQMEIIDLYSDGGKESLHLFFEEGKIYVRSGHGSGGGDSSFMIDLPYGTVSVYRPSRFRIDLTSSEARISIFEGSVEFRRDSRPVSVAQGKMLILGEDRYTEVGQLYERDEWDRWNEARDVELDRRRYAQSYLPPELEPYGYEMEGSGRWIYTPEYRYVWVPTVVVGWAPFRHGYWTWRGGIYCWVPYERWGWLPFHYGRWVHIHLHGWVWVPPVPRVIFWHPGAVAWVMGPTTISWVPLAPGEIYYGYRHYGPHSVVINRNVHIERKVYINAKVKDAVVTIHKDHFLKPGKREPIRVIHTENPFVGKGKVSGPPMEKPIQIGERKVPSRPVKEFKPRTVPERKITMREQKGEPSQKVENPLKKEPNDSNRGGEPIREKIGKGGQPSQQPRSIPETKVRKDPPKSPTTGKSKEETSAPVRPNPDRELIREKVEKGGQSPQQPRSIPTSPPVRGEKARPQDRSVQQQRQEKAVERGSSPNGGREEKKVQSPGLPKKINRNGGDERSRGGMTTKSTPSQTRSGAGSKGIRL
jgi:hypothetical protein